MVALPPPQETSITRVWDAKAAGQGKAWDSLGISASIANDDCARKLWYILRWLLPPEQIEDGRRLAIFETGNNYEQRVIDDFRAADFEVHDVDPDTGKQVRVSLARGFLRGKIDAKIKGLVEAPKTEHVAEIKSAKNTDYNAVVKHGVKAKKPLHYGQLIVYMADLGFSRGAYIIRCKNTDNMHLERLRWEDVKDDARRIIDRVERLVDEHKPPERISTNGDKWPCSFCNFVEQCQRGAMPPRRSCRTCINFTFTSDGNGHCTRFDEAKNPTDQKAGCPAHLFLPGVIPGQVAETDTENETITYEMADGATWVDGKQEYGDDPAS